MSETVAKTSEYFGSGLYCSQAVLGAFSEKYGLDKQTAFNISCGLNSGVRCAEACGAVTGAVLVIGLKYGHDKALCNQKTQEFIELFAKIHGSIVCRDLLNCNIATPDGLETAREQDLFKTRCMDMVVCAAQLLEDAGY